ncbi:MAG TPA: CBS domain-containing protein [Chitinophagaceae bacterium]|jgi:CBS domain-containing protein|nr:CBS domain-containing protein [Chitinophagaceae bacterium]
MRTVQNILDTKGEALNVVAPGTRVIDALNLLNSINLSYLIVKDDDNYEGIFSERDYSRNVILKGKSSSSSVVEEVMTVDFPEVGVNDTVEHCMYLINSHKTRYLLAYDDNEKFVGVITIHDLLRQVLASKEQVFDSSQAQQLIEHAESGRIF